MNSSSDAVADPPGESMSSTTAGTRDDSRRRRASSISSRVRPDPPIGPCSRMIATRPCREEAADAGHEGGETLAVAAAPRDWLGRCGPATDAQAAHRTDHSASSAASSAARSSGRRCCLGVGASWLRISVARFRSSTSRRRSSRYRCRINGPDRAARSSSRSRSAHQPPDLSICIDPSGSGARVAHDPERTGEVARRAVVVEGQSLALVGQVVERAGVLGIPDCPFDDAFPATERLVGVGRIREGMAWDGAAATGPPDALDHVRQWPQVVGLWRRGRGHRGEDIG